MKKITRLLPFLMGFSLFLSLNANLSAREIAEVKLSEQINVDGKTLVLNGAGVRTKFFFKIYIGALYLPEKQKNVKKILSADSANRVVMHFLYDEVEKEKLVDAWLEGFEENVNEKDFVALQGRLKQFNAMFSDLHKNDIVLLDYIPQQGTRVTIKGEARGVIEGQDFNRALLSVWLGEEPVTEELKDAMLGIEDD